MELEEMDNALMKSMKDMLDAVNAVLIQIDECFAANDTNTALKKTHEAISLVKAYKDCLE